MIPASVTHKNFLLSGKHRHRVVYADNGTSGNGKNPAWAPLLPDFNKRLK